MVAGSKGLRARSTTCQWLRGTLDNLLLAHYILDFINILVDHHGILQYELSTGFTGTSIPWTVVDHFEFLTHFSLLPLTRFNMPPSNNL